MNDDRRVDDSPAIDPDVAAFGGSARLFRTAGITILRLIPIVVALVMLATTQDRPIASAGFIALMLAVVFYLDRSPVYRLLASYVLGIAIFTFFRSLADQTFIPTRYEYVITIDSWLFFGHVPTVWLQDRFFEFGNYSWFDQFMVGIHLSYFVIPYGLALGLAFLGRAYFARYIVGLLATFYLGLVIYFLIPTSPPWLASHLGYLPEVTRIVQVIGTEVSPEAYAQGYSVAGANDVAAMPSLHFAITVVIMFAHWRFNWVFRSIFIAYTILMGLALVYLAEHYVIDLIAGFVVAAGGWWIANWFHDRFIRPAEVGAGSVDRRSDAANAG